VKAAPLRSQLRHWIITSAVALAISSAGFAQIRAPEVAAASTPDLQIAAGLAGRNIDSIEVRGNSSVTSGEILNVVRSRRGTPLDPLTVQEDYQRIFGLRRFSNVEALIQPTETGVVLAFVVTEQKALRSVGFRGNTAVRTEDLTALSDLKTGQAIDTYRIVLARRAMEQAYRDKNYPFASITLDSQQLSDNGNLIFIVNEGPNVRIRNIDFIGAKAFDEGELKGKIRSKTWLWVLRPGTLDGERLDDDVAGLQQFYRDKGYFDVRVGRRVIFSPDQTEAQIEFVIDEGPRYKIDKITFRGNNKVTEADLRDKLKLVEGRFFDREIVDRDKRRLVEAFSPFGMIYAPELNNPEYLSIDAVPRFRLEAGSIELVYDINEGREFTLGNIEVRGNTRTLNKVVLREMRTQPGELYNSAIINRAKERLMGTRLFDDVRITPIGDAPGERDLLVEVQESKTALLTFGAGVNSNGGLSGNITYKQRNFDIGRWPRSFKEIFNEDALVGAGQSFTASFEPGTEATSASIRFVDPWVFDQPYSLSVDAFIRDRRREHYRDNRMGGRVAVGKRFWEHYSWSAGIRGERVRIYDIQDKPVRAFEILEESGSNLLLGTTTSFRRDTVNPGQLPYEGTSFSVGWDSFGWMGGDYDFNRFTTSFDWYHTLGEDLTDRKTVLSFHADAGVITGDAPFFERFYGGGLGSVRGFSFRGISPRSGPDDDAIGGDFSLTTSVEISYPILKDQLRGVVFVDAGTVEEDFEINEIRSAVGAGIRMNLPLLGQVPIAVDFAWPVSEADKDETQIISFSLGITP
jgi:outer membrane protein insertion porin family